MAKHTTIILAGRSLAILFFQAVAKTSAAPIERIKLLIQNQDEMVRLVVAPLSRAKLLKFFIIDVA